jgi:protein-tyrosine phosphatase
MTDPSPQTRRRVLVVCLGNYCRSPYAAAVLAAKAPNSLHVRSAGLIDKWVGGTAHPDMIRTAAARGHDLSAHQPAQVDRTAIEEADLVLAMDISVRDQLLTIGGPDNADKIRLYLGASDVPDPMGKPIEAFTTCAQIIDDAAARHLL